MPATFDFLRAHYAVMRKRYRGRERMKKVWRACFVIMFLFVFQPGLADEMPAEEEHAEGSVLLDIVLVIDNSGSMKKNDPQFLTKEVVMTFLDSLDPSTRLGLVIFDKKTEIVAPLSTGVDDDLKAAFLEHIGKIDYTGQFTNSPDGIEQAIYELRTNSRRDAKKVIIFLTDGIIDTGDRSQDLEKTRWLKEDLTAACRNIGINIYGIAFTEEADFSLIQTLGLKTDGNYYRAYQAEDIGAVFDEILEAITRPVVEERPETPEPAPRAPVPIVQPSPPVQIAPPQAEAQVGLFVLGASIMLLLVIVIGGVFYLKFRPATEERVFTPAPGTGKEKPAFKAQLVDMDKAFFQEPVDLDKAQIDIGRELYNDIVIPKNEISSDHAVIEFKDGAFFLTDQESTNGTTVNNNKLTPYEPFRLKNGAVIHFEKCRFQFIRPDHVPSKGTVLSPGNAAAKKTFLSKGGGEKGDAKAPEKKAPPKKAKDEPEKTGSAGQASDAGGKETVLKQPMCKNHASRKATELCLICKQGFCKQCMSNTPVDGKTVCKQCAEASNKKE